MSIYIDTHTHFFPLLRVDCRILVPWLRIKLTLAVKVQSPSASLDNQGVFSMLDRTLFDRIVYIPPPPIAEGLEHNVLACSVTKSRLIPWDLPGSSVHGISQTRILEWAAIPSPGDLPDPGIESKPPALQVDSLPLSHHGSTPWAQHVLTNYPWTDSLFINYYYYYYFWPFPKACRILVLPPGVEPMLPALERQSVNH